jgi:phosphoglycolate phosphatase
MIKVIIFDYDGVIVDSFGSVFESYKVICNRFNVCCPDSIEDFRKMYGYSYIDCYKNLGIKEENFGEAYDIFQTEIIKREHGIFPEILEVIQKLSKTYKLFLVTASHSNEVLPKLKKFNLTDYFEKIYCGADDRIRKSDLFNELLSVNNYSTSEIISIGDRAIDYDVAKKVGISDDNIILVTYGWGLDKSRIGKVNIAESPIDILNFLNK